MLKSDYYIEPTELDLVVFEKLVPQDHYLRQVKAIIDFEFVLNEVQGCYSETMGRSAIDPVRLFKLEYLIFHYASKKELFPYEFGCLTGSWPRPENGAWSKIGCA